MNKTNKAKILLVLAILMSFVIGDVSCTKDKNIVDNRENKSCLPIQNGMDDVIQNKRGSSPNQGDDLIARNRIIDSLSNLPEYSGDYYFSQGYSFSTDSIIDGERVYVYSFPCKDFSDRLFLNVTVTANRLLNMHSLFFDIGNKTFQWYYDNDQSISCCMMEAENPFSTIATYDYYPRRDYAEFTYINYDLLMDRKPRIGVQIYCGLITAYAGYVWTCAVYSWIGGPVTVGTMVACGVAVSVLSTLACRDVE